MSLVAVLGTIFLNVKHESGLWIYDRGPPFIQFLIYLGGGLLFLELSHSFYLVSKASARKYRYIFLSYPIAWAIAYLLFILQQNYFLFIPSYVYQFPNLIGHILFIIALSLPISVLLIPPKQLNKEILTKLNISPSSGIVIIDNKYYIQYLNQVFSNITGLGLNVYQRNLLEFFNEAEIYESSEEIFEFKELLKLPSFIVELKFNKTTPVRLRLEKIMDDQLPHNTIIAERVSDLKVLEADITLLKQQLFDAKEDSVNVETLKIFVKSVAHDLSNVLTNFESIEYLFNAGIANKSLKEIEMAMPFFIQGYNHLKEHVEYLWRMDDESDKEIIDITQSIQQCMTLVQWPIGTDRKLVISENSNLHCFMNGLVFKKIILNILQNAKDAIVISDKKVKKIEVSVTQTIIPDEYGSDENYVKITISNNGPKIPENKIDSIFTRGFSTKLGNKGFGLSICKNLVAKNDGYLSVISNDDKTKFEIVFPQISA